MKIDLTELQKTITKEQIINLMAALGVDEYDDSKEGHIIFPTICHNEDIDEASMKLYYYHQNKMFHCYTECGDTFNIYELVKRVFTIRNYKNGNFTFREVIDFIMEACNIKEAKAISVNKYATIKDRYKKKQHSVELSTYSPALLNLFTKTYPVDWLQEGISKESMDKFDIRYSISQNKIIIPHYNINGELVGIRGRALNKDEIDLYGKYMPVKIENVFYAHPLSQNLYGLNIAQSNISNAKKVILFEGEKSVLLYDTYFDDNIAVAVCGSNFNKVQLQLLLKYCSVEEIIICFDKEYDMAGALDGQKYFQKLWDLCKKYSPYCNMSFVFDREHLLDKKDSPIDKGKDVFLELYKKRIKVQ